MTLPYPPPFQDLATLSQHVCMAERTIENAVKMGLLPQPVTLNGTRLWKWADVAKCLDGFIYFLEAGDLIKIGFSRDLKSRLRALQDMLPFESIVLHTAVGTERMEAYFHSLFADDRVRGEWFKRSPELLQYIERLKAGFVVGESK